MFKDKHSQNEADHNRGKAKYGFVDESLTKNSPGTGMGACKQENKALMGCLKDYSDSIGECQRRMDALMSCEQGRK